MGPSSNGRGSVGDEGRPPTPPRVLVATNDFPPNVGGAEQYVWNLVRHLPPERVAVLAPNQRGWREHDAAQPFAITRWPATSLWPTTDLGRRIRSLVREHESEVVLFGQAVPAALLGRDLARRGIPYVVLTHGLEVWMSRIPGPSRLLRLALSGAKEVTAVSRYTATSISGAVAPGARLTVLYPGVDQERFSPTVDGLRVRARLRLEERKIILCVGRHVPRKGQDVLIRSMPLVRHLVPEAALVLVGEGRYRAHLEGMAQGLAPGAVVFAGGVPADDIPDFYGACDVFAMPCRSRFFGLEVEGFGIVFLEAAASGKASVAGRSGGAAEAVADEESGVMVEGREDKAVALAVARLLLHRDVAARLGAAGRARVERRFTWQLQADRLARILHRAAG